MELTGDTILLPLKLRIAEELWLTRCGMKASSSLLAPLSPTNITPRLRNDALRLLTSRFGFAVLPLVAGNPSPMLYDKWFNPTESLLDNVPRRLNPWEQPDRPIPNPYCNTTFFGPESLSR